MRVVVLALAAMLLLVGSAMLRGRPQDLPWTPLDLAQPVGLFTGRKLAGLRDDTPRCRALLDRAGVRHIALAPLHDGPSCGYDDAVRMRGGGPLTIDWSPSAPGVSCPVAAALALWEWEVVEPAARRHLHAQVVAIEHLGSYNCRRMYGRDHGSWSEHATANAIDIAGFRLSNGRRIGILSDWKGEGDAAAFLREVRDGACGLFATVLSPDYNAAHRDHLHLDQAARGARGWRSCR